MKASEELRNTVYLHENVNAVGYLCIVCRCVAVAGVVKS